MRYSPGLGSLLYLALFLVFPVPVPAQQTSAAIPSTERASLAETYTAERLAVWQGRLNLQDWSISVVLSRTGDLKPKTLGNIHWDADKKTAVIRVLHPADYKMPFPEMLRDMEFTIVHELIHLELSSLPRSDASRREEEYAVNRIAEALTRLDRDRTDRIERPRTTETAGGTGRSGNTEQSGSTDRRK